MRYTGLLVSVAAVASGCQAMPRAVDYSNVSPVYETQAPTRRAAVEGQIQAPAYVPPLASSSSNAQLEASLLNMKERLERVEKAMLRLDRRMQLVEKNELSRMSGQISEATQAPTGTEEQMALQALNLGASPAAGPSGDFVSVSARAEDTITSALQAAPKAGSGAWAPAEAEPQPRRVAGLPSLADPAPSQGGAATAPVGQMAIWTVRYDADRVWPERDQLPSSKGVVESLRQSGGMTLYARGKNANGVQFRERVKALSRYLSKVSGVESVPIVAMAAPHLDDQTIEVLAASR